eukprot:7762361-Alexandrium_andersonii.AAC.1
MRGSAKHAAIAEGIRPPWSLSLRLWHWESLLRWGWPQEPKPELPGTQARPRLPEVVLELWRRVAASS